MCEGEGEGESEGVRVRVSSAMYIEVCLWCWPFEGVESTVKCSAVFQWLSGLLVVLCGNEHEMHCITVEVCGHILISELQTRNQSQLPPPSDYPGDWTDAQGCVVRKVGSRVVVMVTFFLL